MIRKIAAALVGFLLCAFEAQAAPLEAYGRLPNVEDAALSPSGERLALIVTNGEDRTIVVQTAIDRKILLVAPTGKSKLRDLTWASEDHLLLTTSSAKLGFGVRGSRRERYVAFVLDLKSRRARPLMDDLGNVQAMNTVSGVPVVRTLGGKISVFARGTHFQQGKGRLGLFKVDLETLRGRLVDDGGADTYDWIVDQDGQVIAKAGFNGQTSVWTLRMKSTDGVMRTIEKVASPIETPDLLGITADGKSVVVESGDEVAGNSWRELSRDTSTWVDPVANSAGGAPIFAPGDVRIIGRVALIGDRLDYRFFDPAANAAWRAIKGAFAGEQVTLVSWSYNRRKVLVRVDSKDLGPALALVDLDAGKADWLGPEYEGLQAADVSPRGPFSYKAADGLAITGYLTLPKGRDPKGLPLVVLPHGGPHSRDEPGFDWWAQALASRGYAVLQPNFRGSSGFSREFMAAGFGEIGRKMQSDLSDGVRSLASQGLIDPKRVCIVGASYGGYAALAGVTLDRGVYRCAVSVGGVSDLSDLVAGFRANSGMNAQRFWLRYIGADDVRDPVLAQYSPSARAAEADGPVLLIHGRDDTVVPIGHSRKMAKALQAAGKPVELVELAGEDHWLSSGATRLQMLQATVAFLERHNPPN